MKVQFLKNPLENNHGFNFSPSLELQRHLIQPLVDKKLQKLLDNSNCNSSSDTSCVDILKLLPNVIIQEPPSLGQIHRRNPGNCHIRSHSYLRLQIESCDINERTNVLYFLK